MELKKEKVERLLEELESQRAAEESHAEIVIDVAIELCRAALKSL